MGWEDPLEKEMATHSSVLAWKIPWTEESGGLQPMGSQRVGHKQNRRCTHVTPGFLSWNHTLQCDGIRRWAFGRGLGLDES